MTDHMMIETICPKITALRLAPNDTIMPEVIWFFADWYFVRRG